MNPRAFAILKEIGKISKVIKPLLLSKYLTQY
jgi:hypothetical protein